MKVEHNARDDLVQPLRENDAKRTDAFNVLFDIECFV
jgi:hypothetical protein